MSLRFHRRRAVIGTVITGGLLAAAGVGAAYASGALTSDPATTVIQACEQTRGGFLSSLLNPVGSIRIVDDNRTDCRRGETPISWNVQGPAGPEGPTGAAGAKGQDGKDGAPGAPGKDGATILSGSGAPSPDTGSGGDFYIDTATNTLFGPKTDGDWGDGTSLVGPKGADGASGTDGATILSGSGAPSPDTGSAGDFYIDTATNTLFGPKTDGDWGDGTSLVGPKGDRGETGAAGAAGQDGAPGAPGKDGATILSGSGAPSGGVDGDFYIDTATNTLYGPKSGRAWGEGTSLVGPQGDRGEAGATGAAGQAGAPGAPGKDGATILSGSGAPTGGNDGDFYIDTATNTLYGPKSGGVWGEGTSLVGPAGKTGPQGDAGLTGETGPQGPAGSDGQDGKDGNTILNGIGAPASTIGNVGDFYLDTSATVLYGPKTADGWGDGVSLIGSAAEAPVIGMPSISPAGFGTITVFPLEESPYPTVVAITATDGVTIADDNCTGVTVSETCTVSFDAANAKSVIPVLTVTATVDGGAPSSFEVPLTYYPLNLMQFSSGGQPVTDAVDGGRAPTSITLSATDVSPTLTNIGVSIIGTYAILDDGCTGQSLRPHSGDTCTITVADNTDAPAGAHLTVSATVTGPHGGLEHQISKGLYLVPPLIDLYSPAPAAVGGGITVPPEGTTVTVIISYENEFQNLEAAVDGTYTITDDGCSGAPLASPETCTLTVVPAAGPDGQLTNGTLTVTGVDIFGSSPATLKLTPAA